MTASQLKASILDLAIRGKLVAQDPKDEPAAKLLERIREGRALSRPSHRTASAAAPIAEDEKPFDLPVGWEWVRLGDAVSFMSRGKSPKYVESSKCPMFAQKCNQPEGIFLDRCRMCDPKTFESFDDEFRLRDLDVVVNSTGTGTLGRVGLFLTKYLDNAGYKEIVPDSHVTVVRSPFGDLNKYLFHLLRSAYAQTWINDHMDGSTNQKELYTRTFVNLLVPLPPLAEQKRIVAKVEELLPMVEEYGAAFERRRKMVGELPEKLRKSILQRAIEGKLVAQDPDDEPASELLAKIAAEKARLQKNGKAKKEKPLPPIADDEKPFDLPDGWAWVRLGEVCASFKYGTANKSLKVGRVPVLRMGNLQHGEIDYTDLAYTNDQNDIAAFALSPGDLLFNRTNSSEMVGKVSIVRDSRTCIYAGYLVKFRPIKISSEYANIVLNSEYQRRWCHQVKSDAIGQSNISASKLAKFIFPLPPLAEQKRIVAKVESLLADVERLKQSTEA